MIKDNKQWRGCGENGALAHVDRNAKWCSHYGKQHENSSKNYKENCHKIQQFHFWVYIQKNWNKDLGEILAFLFIAAIAEMWKQHKCPLMDDWIKKMWNRHIMEYYAGLKKKEILQYGTIWMNLEEIMLSEVSQSQKDRQILHDSSYIRHLK